MLGDNFFSKYKSVADLQREQQEFEARKRINDLQTLKLERDVMAPEQLSPKQLIAKAIQFGGVDSLSPQEQAQLQAFDISQRTKQSVDPRGNIITNRSIYDMLPGQINQMPPREVMSAPITQALPQAPEYTPYQADAIVQDIFQPDVMPTEEQNLQGGVSQPVVLTREQPAISVPDVGGLSPYGREDLVKRAAEANMAEQANMAREQRAAAMEGQKKRAENKMAYDAFSAAMSNVESSMGNAMTGPIAGQIPAMTAEAQIAEGATSTLAPILKQLFRTAGEGTFTDKDQELLMNMVPTRTDLPEARQQKIRMIDEVVRAKLGMGAIQSINPTQVDNLLNKYAPR